MSDPWMVRSLTSGLPHRGGKTAQRESLHRERAAWTSGTLPPADEEGKSVEARQAGRRGGVCACVDVDIDEDDEVCMCVCV